MVQPTTKVVAIVDYAHTPDALEKVLLTIQQLRTGRQRIITVVGCGGNRDRAKRPIMAATAIAHSDRVILTSDNPRFEEPETILKDMQTGISTDVAGKITSIVSRREAIETAYAEARPGDIILVAGKGHEKYQEVNGVKHPFDDKEVLRSVMVNDEN